RELVDGRGPVRVDLADLVERDFGHLAPFFSSPPYLSKPAGSQHFRPRDFAIATCSALALKGSRGPLPRLFRSREAKRMLVEGVDSYEQLQHAERETPRVEDAPEAAETDVSPAQRLASNVGNQAFAALARQGAGILPDGRAHPDVEQTIARTR